MGEISPLPLLPGTPSPPLPNPKLQNHFAANKTRKEQLEMLSKKQEKVFTGSKTPKKEEFLSCSKAEKQENLFVPPTRVRNHDYDDHHHLDHHHHHDPDHHHHHHLDHHHHKNDHHDDQGPAARVRNPSKRDRTRKHSSGKLVTRSYKLVQTHY